jgi:competence protein ComEA
MNFAKTTAARRCVVAVLAIGLIAVSVATAPVLAQNGSRTAAAEGPPAAKIDLNQATLDQLETIPGVGPSLARRILDFRTEQGPFRRIEDLLKIKGIGEKSFQKMQAYVMVEAEA